MGFNHLLLGRLQIAGSISFGTQRLHGIHDIVLLSQKGITELLRPVELFIHLLQNLRHRGQRLDGRIPGLLDHGILECLASHFRVGLDPARSLNHFQWVSGSHQNLSQQGVRIEGDRRHQLIQLLLRKGFACRRNGGLGGLILLSNRRTQCQQHGRHQGGGTKTYCVH